MQSGAKAAKAAKEFQQPAKEEPMLDGNKIWIGTSNLAAEDATPENRCYLLLNQANRHGIISGASGTGKTVTLKVLAEGFSQAGVPVFMADVKGDVTGMAQAGDSTENIQKRVARFGIENWKLQGCPCRFWDMLGGQGIPVRVTISDMGPTLLARLLDLTEAQEGVLNIAFRVADDNQLLLIDLKDLRSMLNYVADHSKELETNYGHIARASVGAVLRSLIAVEDQGGNVFFGEPALDLNDWFACDANGQGYVNILNAAQLMQRPTVYAMFLLWMLSSLFSTLPEVGDPEKPRFVFFFDEAHLLFDNMPKSLNDKIVQVVKLIRSKGVGVYFITQSPSDIPDEVLAQLSNRVQHGLRAFTPSDQKMVKAAAQGFRVNPKFNTEEAILNLGTGEALVSFLDEEGRPSVVENAKILPPQCLMAAASSETLQASYAAQASLQEKYGTALDRESAYEQLSAAQGKQEQEGALAEERAALEKEKAELEAQKAKAEEAARKKAEKEEERAARAAEKKAAAEEKARQKKEEQFERQIASLATSFTRTAGNKIVRSILGNLLK